MDENTQRNAVRLDVEAVRQIDQAVQPPKETYRSLPEYVEPSLPGTVVEANGDDSKKAAKNGVAEIGVTTTTTSTSNAAATTDAAATNPNATMRDTNATNDHIEDGAGDAMLATDEKEQLASGIGHAEVKFISPEHGKNGDAKIDIAMTLEKSFTGMTKEELMRYANDPFWVRLRWIFFILFWGLWIAMLVGAILIIVGAPKCAAPKALPWYKQGPLVQHSSSADDFPDSLTAAQLQRLQSVGARGAIFTVAPEHTYLIGHSAAIDSRIEAGVKLLTAAKIAAIVDLTANWVPKDDALFNTAIGTADDDVAALSARQAFIFTQSTAAGTPPNNWLSNTEAGGSAWQELPAGSGRWVLAQSGADRYDVQLNATVARDRLKTVLRRLATLGVRGVRLQNARHFIVNKELRDEVQAAAPTAGHDGYAFWQHTQTTDQPGLGELLGDLQAEWKNATGGEGFLSVADNIGQRPEVFFVASGGAEGVNGTRTSELAFELPIVGALPRTLAQPGTAKTAGQLFHELQRAVQTVGNASWVQWQYDGEELAKGAVGLSEYNAFVMLLPGVAVAPVELFEVGKAKVVPVSADVVVKEVAEGVTNATVVVPAPVQKAEDDGLLGELEALRQTPSYQHGSFAVYANADESVVAYTRIKSGNPGYFVAYNPTDALVHANFSAVQQLPEQLTVLLFSANYQAPNVVEKAKVPADAIPVDARSVVILTYVPK